MGREGARSICRHGWQERQARRTSQERGAPGVRLALGSRRGLAAPAPIAWRYFVALGSCDIEGPALPIDGLQQVGIPDGRRHDQINRTTKQPLHVVLEVEIAVKDAVLSRG